MSSEAQSGTEYRYLAAAPLTLFVGLGGSGHEAVKRTRRKIEERAGDVGNRVRYLVMDTDIYTHNDPAFDSREYVSLGGFDANQVLDNKDGWPHVDEWWDYGSQPVGSIFEGTKQQRHVGRLGFFVKYNDEVYGKLHGVQSLLEQISAGAGAGSMDKAQSVKVHIFVVGSLCGGTGSGILLDVCYNLRQLFGDRAFLTGVLLLPGPFIDAMGNELQKRHVQANAYATLRELEYFMNLPAGKQFVACYLAGDRPLQMRLAPLDRVLLVDNRNRWRQRLGDLDATLDMIALALYLMSVSPLAVPRGQEGGKAFGYWSLSDNITLLESEIDPTTLTRTVFGSLGCVSLSASKEPFIARYRSGYRRALLRACLGDSQPDRREDETSQTLRDDLARSINSLFEGIDDRLPTRSTQAAMEVLLDMQLSQRREALPRIVSQVQQDITSAVEREIREAIALGGTRAGRRLAAGVREWARAERGRLGHVEVVGHLPTPTGGVTSTDRRRRQWGLLGRRPASPPPPPNLAESFSERFKSGKRDLAVDAARKVWQHVSDVLVRMDRRLGDIEHCVGLLSIYYDEDAAARHPIRTSFQLEQQFFSSEEIASYVDRELDKLELEDARKAFFDTLFPLLEAGSVSVETATDSMRRWLMTRPGREVPFVSAMDAKKELDLVVDVQGPEAAGERLANLMSYCTPWWQVPVEYGGDTLSQQSLRLLGIGYSTGALGRSSSAWADVLSAHGRYTVVNPYDPGYIDALHTVHGFSLHQLGGLRTWQDYYEEFLQKRRSVLHPHKDWPKELPLVATRLPNSGKNRSTLQMPNLLGTTVSEAKMLLKRHGIDNYMIGRRIMRDGDGIGKVVEQLPRPGRDVMPSRGNIIAYLGVVQTRSLTQVEVPDVVGLAPADARARLTKAGLNFYTEYFSAGKEDGAGDLEGNVAVGKVAAQAPEAGCKVDQEHSVTIWVRVE